MNTAPSLKILQQRIEFIKGQIEALNDYLPETYQLLMSELDAQNRMLMKHIINEYYQQEEQ